MTRGRFFLLLFTVFLVLFVAVVHEFGFGGIFFSGMAVGIFLIIIGRKKHA